MLNYSKRLHDLRRTLIDMEEEVPEVSAHFGNLHDVAMRDGVLPNKYKELMALGIAVAMGCAGCIAIHVNDAVVAGATKQDILETVGVAVAMGGGSALTYAADAYRAYHEIMNDTQDYGDDRTFID